MTVRNPTTRSPTRTSRVDYAKTDMWLVRQAKSSLDVAASRLLENPGLARRLVDGTL